MGKDTKIMADLLRAGYKMLNISCPICKNPIFQDRKEQKFCPICSREVIIVNGKNNLNSEYLTHNVENINKINASNILDKEEILLSLTKVVIEKIRIVNDKLRSENQIDMLKKYSDILLKLLEILMFIKKIKYQDK